MEIQPIFIMGSARSGTTLLASMIANSQRVASYKAETLLMYGCDKTYGKLSSVSAKKRFATDWVKSRQYRRLGLAEGVALDHLAKAASYDELVKLLMDDLARTQGKLAWLDSTPANVYALRAIGKRFPNAKVIHIIRDGRAVAASLRKLGWTTIAGTSQFGALQYSALKWAAAVQSFQRDNHYIAGGVLEVTYESLVTEADSVLDAVWRYLEFSGDDIPSSLFSDDSAEASMGKMASNSAFGCLGSGVRFVDIATYPFGHACIYIRYQNDSETRRAFAVVVLNAVGAARGLAYS